MAYNLNEQVGTLCATPAVLDMCTQITGMRATYASTVTGSAADCGLVYLYRIRMCSDTWLGYSLSLDAIVPMLLVLH
eukprot:16899-Eustigmatos_ZCMA.PRE.1